MIDAELLRVATADKLLLLRDFNARVGTHHMAWEGVTGRYGIGKFNSKGHRLLTFCSQNELLVTKALFDLKDFYKGSWMHPRTTFIICWTRCFSGKGTDKTSKSLV